MKRFYEIAAVEKTDEGHAVLLDGRPVKTPGKTALLLPNRPLAEAVAAEWAAQGEKLKPETMPMTRYANTVLDRVIPEMEAVAAEIAAYGATDLLYYRAESPVALKARQARDWNPVIAWANGRFRTALKAGEGIIFVSQSEQDLQALTFAVKSCSPWALAALHTLVKLSGSLLLGLAVMHGRHDGAAAFALSRIDEEWQIECWGKDAEAEKAGEEKRSDFLAACRFLELTRLH